MWGLPTLAVRLMVGFHVPDRNGHRTAEGVSAAHAAHQRREGPSAPSAPGPSANCPRQYAEPWCRNGDRKSAPGSINACRPLCVGSAGPAPCPATSGQRRRRRRPTARNRQRTVWPGSQPWRPRDRNDRSMRMSRPPTPSRRQLTRTCSAVTGPRTRLGPQAAALCDTQRRSVPCRGSWEAWVFLPCACRAAPATRHLYDTVTSRLLRRPERAQE